MRPFETDVRKPADPGRKRAFVRGFNDSATGRRADYKEKTLKRLTWQNLGYRLGFLNSEIDRHETHKLFEWYEEDQADLTTVCPG